MRAALIPPIPMLSVFGRGDFHLLLSHLFNNVTYAMHYRRQREHGAYLVLDNSAHEHTSGQAASLLRTQALFLSAQEVVVPDVLEDAGGTLEGAISAHECWFESDDRRMIDLSPTLMYVPQATSPHEWGQCLKELVALHTYTAARKDIRKDYVIGISKDYELWSGGIERLIDDYIPHHQKVHLLGWGRNLWELGHLARKYPWIRSTDSAKPFVYAMKDIKLYPKKKIPKYPGRPGDYFNRRMQSRRCEIAEHNIYIFRQLAGGTIE